MSKGDFFGLLILAACGWFLFKSSGLVGMHPDPYDGTMATFYVRHWFGRDESYQLKLLPNKNEDDEEEGQTSPLVWQAKNKLTGKWHPFFYESDYNEPQ